MCERITLLLEGTLGVQTTLGLLLVGKNVTINCHFKSLTRTDKKMSCHLRLSYYVILTPIDDDKSIMIELFSLVVTQTPSRSDQTMQPISSISVCAHVCHMGPISDPRM